ncbi:hypothetical protein LZC95_41420 [Pendulispora brunnea]|uniref:Uncharacterized protein n=1 Tax=Pendulispora brunnea TaxID=2905690 RepID=A0ABZ2K2E2_9BACT
MSSRIRRRVVALAVALSFCAAACASILGMDDFSLEGKDAGGDVSLTEGGPGPVDAGGPCDPDAQFTKLPVPGLTDLGWRSMRAATLSPDELTIYFNGSPDGGRSNIYRAKRNARAEDFKDVELLPNVNDLSVPNLSPSLSSDEKTLVFSRQVTSTDLFFASRPRKTDEFGNAVRFNNRVNSDVSDVNPFIALDGQELWFSSDRDASSATPHMFMAKASAGAFDNPVSVAPPDPTSSRQESPVLSADGTILFYSGNGENDATDANDIWEARREATNLPFQKRRHVTELGTKGIEYPSWLSPDGCHLYMHSLEGTVGAIYVGERKR